MPDLVTRDNLTAFDILDTVDQMEDDTGPDFHLVVYTLEGEHNTQWVPDIRITADQLAKALRSQGLLQQEGQKH